MVGKTICARMLNFTSPKHKSIEIFSYFPPKYFFYITMTLLRICTPKVLTNSRKHDLVCKCTCSNRSYGCAYVRVAQIRILSCDLSFVMSKNSVHHQSILVISLPPPPAAFVTVFMVCVEQFPMQSPIMSILHIPLTVFCI